MKKFFEKVSPSLFVGLILAIVGFIYNANKESILNEKRYIDSWSKVDFSGLDTLELKQHNFQILYNGNSIYGFTTIDVELFNFSDRDCENVRILIDIIPQNNDSLQLVEGDIYGPHGHEDGVTTVKDNSEGALKGRMKFEYLIETANRADSARDLMFKASYGIISETKPKISVSIIGKGIEKRKYSRTHYEKLSWWESDFAEWIFVIIGYTLLIIIMVKTSRYFASKKNKRWRKYLIKNLTESIDGGKLNYNAESIANIHDEISNRFDYDDASRFIRWIKRLKPPVEE